MSSLPPKSCIAFQGVRVIATGSLSEVALAARVAVEQDPAASVLVFDDETGGVVDLDLRGTAEEVVARLAERAGDSGKSDGQSADFKVARAGRGRPRLGVVAREVTLLPRHWDWLSAQPGGASNAIRRLTETALREDAGKGRARASREAAYRFMSAMAGDLPGFEEASRALFADDRSRFLEHCGSWPADISAYVTKLAWREE